jgi:single-strand DNA-binding protein
MNSFKVTAIGRIGKALELMSSGNTNYVRFPVIANDFAGKDREQTTTTVYFTAFGTIAEALANNARVGDQLILEAKMESNNYNDGNQQRYGYSFIVEGFQFGAPGKESREILSRNAA